MESAIETGLFTEPSAEEISALDPALLALSPTARRNELIELEQQVQGNNVLVAEKMVTRQERRTPSVVFEKGDIVTLKIPKANRKSTDPIRIQCRVVKVHGNSHKLLTQWGRLKNNYPVSQLLRPEETVGAGLGGEVPEEELENIITLNAAVGKMMGRDRLSGAKVKTQSNANNTGQESGTEARKGTRSDRKGIHHDACGSLQSLVRGTSSG